MQRQQVWAPGTPAVRKRLFASYGNELKGHHLSTGSWAWLDHQVQEGLHSKEQLLEQKACGLERKLIGFEMVDRGIPRKGYTVLSDQGEEIGGVSSGTHSPSLDRAIGLAYISAPHSLEGSVLQIQIRNKKVEAKVVRTPFL